MSRLFICYENDLPSLNMKKQLLSKLKWEDIGNDGVNSYLQNGDNILMTIDRMHVNAEDIDESARQFGIDVKDIIVLSRHSSASGKPTLTVHPIGNYRDNSMGGKEQTLVKAMPHMMSATLRQIKKHNDTPDYGVSFEVTHHGPFVSVPTMYIEIGSDENHWGDMHAAEILTDSLLSAEEHEEYPVVIGVGGGHYAPRFSDLVHDFKVDMGHMVPNYQTNEASDDDVIRMIRSAAEATGTKLVYVHRNSMKGAEERRMNGLIDSLGYERMTSKDFESI